LIFPEIINYLSEYETDLENVFDLFQYLDLDQQSPPIPRVVSEVSNHSEESENPEDFIYWSFNKYFFDLELLDTTNNYLGVIYEYEDIDRGQKMIFIKKFFKWINDNSSLKGKITTWIILFNELWEKFVQQTKLIEMNSMLATEMEKVVKLNKVITQMTQKKSFSRNEKVDLSSKKNSLTRENLKNKRKTKATPQLIPKNKKNKKESEESEESGDTSTERID